MSADNSRARSSTQNGIPYRAEQSLGRETSPMSFGDLHHVEIRTIDLAAASRSWGWLLGELGYKPFQEWADGQSWQLDTTYLVLETAPARGQHDRRLPGLSHLAFHAGTQTNVERLWRSAPEHGWNHLYGDRWPWAGGPKHFAAFLENEERFKLELVASEELR